MRDVLGLALALCSLAACGDDSTLPPDAGDAAAVGDASASDGGTDAGPECSVDADCDDALYCNGVETCVDGACVAGTGPELDDGVECTTDTCDDATDTILHTPADAACDDGLFCNGAEACDAATGCMAGTAPVADDGIDCTNDSCDEALDAIVNEPDDSACGDADDCTDDMCTAGVGCSHPFVCTCTTSTMCDDGNPCTSESCTDGACVYTDTTGSCDDGVYCNGADMCSGGACVHAGDPCSGGAECADACNETADTCFAPAMTACTDDGNSCTADACNGSGTCAHPPSAGACDDGIYCNGADTCSAGSCVHAGNPCASGTECNDRCDEALTSCADPAGTSCDDGLFCNGADMCSAGMCAHAGDPCAGGTACNDLCNEGGDHCRSPAGASCPDDGMSCTADVCDGAGACTHTAAPESLCGNSMDDDCDGLSDCADPDCAPLCVCPTPPPDPGNVTSWAMEGRGETLTAVTIVGSTIWAAGLAGTVAHGVPGGAWTVEQPRSITTVNKDIWASSASDVWVLEERGVAYYNGTTWAARSTGSTSTTDAIEGCASDDVWVAQGGVPRHWTGSAYMTHAYEGGTAAMYDLHCLSPSAVWAVGNGGRVERWNGSAWMAMPSPGATSLVSVGSSSASNVWAVGYSGMVARWDGAAWTVLPAPTTELLYDVWPRSATDAWVVSLSGLLYHWDGSGWSTTDLGLGHRLIDLESSGSTAWIVGDAGTVLRFSGGSWTDLTPGPRAGLNAVFSVDGSEIWAVGDDGVALRSAGTGTWTPTTTGTTNALRGVWGAAENDVWVAGNGGTILHWNGSAWSAFASGTTEDLRAVSGSSASDVWIVGGAAAALGAGVTLHWNGTAWSTSTATSLTLYDVHVNTPTDAWAAASRRAVYRWNGTSWSAFRTSTSTRANVSVWGLCPNDMYVVDSQEVIDHWDGMTWTGDSRSFVSIDSMWGSSARDRWTVGATIILFTPFYTTESSIARHDGTSWDRPAIPTQSGLNDLWTDGGDVWVVGYNGTILHGQR